MGRDENPATPADRPLNILLLYDRYSLFTNTVREHVESFSRFSRHQFYYAHATSDAELKLPLDDFDVVILHYSIRLPFNNISPEFAWALRTFKGLKALFIQDEYDNTWRACKWIDQLGIRLVFTCVPPEHVRQIYSRVNHDRVTFIQTLTGFLPIDSDLEKHVKPLAERPTVIGYRGRPLPFKYGRLGQEKLIIGVRMRAECEARGIPCDIEWTENRRIYGDAWPKFIASCRATLGSESGSNVFDFDGTLATNIAAAVAQNPKITYEEVEARFIGDRELDRVMNQVSPRIFEAVALRTGLVLFEGTYSGVVRPDEHFIPLKKDFSNVDEVLRRVQDDRELSAMTDRAYRHVIESGLYTYQTFIRGVDEALVRFACPQHSSDRTVAADWPRAPDVRIVNTVNTRYRWLSLPRRAARKILRKAWHLAYLHKIISRARQLRAAHMLVMQDPVLRESHELVRTHQEMRINPPSRLQLLREWHRLAVLRHGCRKFPTVQAPFWLSLSYDTALGRIAIVAHPTHDLPTGITSGQAVIEQATAAIRTRSVKEIVWDRSGVQPEISLNLGKLGNVSFYLGDPVFRFTTLERLADLEPEMAARVLAHTVDGIRTIAPSSEKVAEKGYRQAS